MRAFLALEIPAATKDELSQSREGLVPRLPKARWVRPEGMHLTIKFLGEAADAVATALAEGLRPQLAGLGSLSVELGNAGFFPSPRRPRIAWIGGRIGGAEPLVEAVESAAEAHGFKRERRRWSLHLTQARLNRPWPAAAVEQYLEWGRRLRLEPFECSELVLYESRLQPGGAVYTALERLSFR